MAKYADLDALPMPARNNVAFEADPRVAELTPKPPLFDVKRMRYGGFIPIVNG